MARTGSQSRLSDSLSQIEHIEIAEGIYGYRFGRIAIVTWYISKQFTPNAFTELATLPASMRPPHNMYFPVELSASSARAFINAEGRFTIYSFTTASQSQGTIAFPIA